MFLGCLHNFSRMGANAVSGNGIRPRGGVMGPSARRARSRSAVQRRRRGVSVRYHHHTHPQLARCSPPPRDPLMSVDLDQAAATPIPPTPPADKPDFAQAVPDLAAGPTTPAEEIHVQATEEAHAEGEPNGVVEAVVEDPVAVPQEHAAGEQVQQPASQAGDTTAQDGERAQPAPSSRHIPRDSVSSVQSAAPTPPSKATDLPEVASPPQRRDSLTPSVKSTTTNGQTRPSVDAKRANGRVPGQGAPPRPDSASSHRRSLTLSKGRTISAALITSALETIAASKDAKRSAPLRESVQHALEMVKHGQGGDRPREVFEPLRLACETRNEKLMIASLDCISKLISYSFFTESSPPSSSQGLPSPPPSPGPGASRHSTSSSTHPSVAAPTLVDLVVHTITSCHSESTPDTVSLQIVKALLALVLSQTILVHQSSLLKAVRTVYNIFLLSTDPINQTVAQGGLAQMVNHVFARCKLDSAFFPTSESTATVASSRDSERGERGPSMKRSYVPTSPLSVQRPLSPPSSAEYTSIEGTMESGATAVETPASQSTELASEDQHTETSEAASEEKVNGHAPQLTP